MRFTKLKFNFLSDDFGIVEKSYVNLDYEIPIRATIGDSQASVIAECCFKPGDCVITIGSGSFISVVTGDKPFSSNNGNYPIVGYKFKNEKLYFLHSFVSNAGQSIDWAKSIGLFDQYSEIDDILEKTPDSGKVYYVPTLFDLPGFDKNLTGSGFVGICQNSTKNQMIRAIFESIAFLIRIKVDAMQKDLKSDGISLNSIR